MHYSTPATLPAPYLPRLLTSLCLAAAVTFGLFALMERLIHQDQVMVHDPEPLVPINMVFEAPKESLVKQDRLPPPPKPQPKMQTIKPETPVDPNDGGEGIDIAIEIPDTALGNKGIGELTMSGGEARPLVRINPKYPIDAARDGIEGWVKLIFDIDASGQVVNVKVIDANPKRTFNREAIRALRKWKYKPNVVDGKPVMQTGLQVVLDFNMDQAS